MRAAGIRPVVVSPVVSRVSPVASPVLSVVVAVVALVGAGLVLPAPATAAPPDLPDAAPPAARAAEPRLPDADGWPFSQRHFPRTSGTGRLHGGAQYWSDFVYDDHGASLALGTSAPYATNLAPTQGVYTYPDGSAHGNGADIFRTAVGLDRRSTYWRVDWTTLADPAIPMAIWTFDRDGSAATGVSQWPAKAGVTSPGIDTALLVTSDNALLVNLVTGKSATVARLGGDLVVDRQAAWFVVRLPRRVLPPRGSWTVRVAAGVANETGSALEEPFLPDNVPPPPTAARIYNVGYRDVRQEPPVFRSGRTDALVAAFERQAAANPALGGVGADGLARFVTGNFWMEDHQADALVTGDVSAFAETVTWSRLARGERTAEPRPRGYSNRWYVSRLRLGQGVLTGADQGNDLRPNFLGRIQPYAVYVPRQVPATRAMPLTWVLHSLGVNHNQYGALNPALLQRLCERRGSVCATTLGHGPDGWYLDEAEADYWAVWRELAETYRLSPDRTQVTGYSMGGYAAYKLGLQHPDLYAGAMSLAGPPACGSGADPDRGLPLSGQVRCEKDGATGPLLGNALHVPYRIGQGTLDQLVPFVSVEEQVRRLDALGLRHRFVRFPGEDHMVFATQDRFDTVLEGLGTPRAVRNPGRVEYSWFPHLDRPAMGLRAGGAYWVRGLRAKDRGPGALARVSARSFARPDRAHTVVRSGPTPVASPLPAVVSALGWRSGLRPGARPLVTLRLVDVDRATVDLRRAGLRCGRVRVVSDTPVLLTLRRYDGRVQRVSLPTGRRTVRVRC